MSVSEHVAKGEREETDIERRRGVEILCDTLNRKEIYSLTVRALLRGVETADEARRLAHAEALRKKRHSAEPRQPIIKKANEMALELEGGDDGE
jgi:Mg-chelatase subunit ChlD